jgi:hypothetical protein
MSVVLRIGLCCLLAGGAWAQRGGMGRGGGMGGGGVRSGFSGGGFRGGSAGFNRGLSGGGFNRGFSGGGFRGFNGFGGFGGFGGHRGFGGFRGTNSFWGFGLGLGFGYGGFGYSWPYYSYPYVGGYWPGYSDVYPYDYGYGYSSPAVTVVYGPQPQVATAPVVIERATPVTREYDQFGQEVKPAAPAAGSSPIYLIAFRDNVIRAAAAYWVDGSTLHYVTLQHEEKQAPLDSVDRALTLQLNRERHVDLRLP